MPSDSLQLTAWVASIFAVAVFLGTYQHAKRVLAVAVGLTAGLITAQAGGAHFFTIATVLFAVFSGQQRRGVLGRIVLVSSASALMAATAWLGPLAKTTNTAVQLMALTASAVLFLARSDEDDVRIARNALLAFVSVGAVIGLLQGMGLVANDLFTPAHNTEAHRPAGFYPEPDWLGMYSAVGVVLAATSRDLRQRSRLALIALNGAGVVLASARSAILALAVVAVWSIVRSQLARRADPRRLQVGPLIVLGGSALVAGVLVFPTQVDLLFGRLEAAVLGQGQVVQSRWAQLEGLSALAHIAPWYGNGMSASGRVSVANGIVYGSVTDGPTSGANWLLSLWGDGMVLSVLLIAVVIWCALFGNSAGSSILLAVLVNSLFSNAFSFPITWFAVALALAPKNPPRPDFELLEPSGDPGRRRAKAPTPG